MKAGLENSPGFKAKMEAEKQRILADYFVEKRITDQVSVTPREIEDYYNSHKQEFNQKEMVRTAQIVVKTEEEAKGVKALLAKGEPFETVARQKSIDFSAKRGGELGWQELERMPRPLQDAILALQKGQVSDIVKTESGYCILKLMDERKPVTRSLKDATPLIEQRLKAGKIATLKKRYRDEAKVKILDQSLMKEQAPGKLPFPMRRQ